MKDETIHSSKQMLHLLRQLVSDSQEVYNGIVWQLVCCPFTPFLTLFGEILANRGALPAEVDESLAAMRELPIFLQRMGIRNSLAARLEPIATVFVQHAESLVHPAPGSSALESSSGSGLAKASRPDEQPVSVNNFDWDSFLNFTSTSLSGPFEERRDNAGYTGSLDLEDTAQWANMFLGDPSIDWIGFAGTLPD